MSDKMLLDRPRTDYGMLLAAAVERLREKRWDKISTMRAWKRYDDADMEEAKWRDDLVTLCQETVRSMQDVIDHWQGIMSDIVRHERSTTLPAPVQWGHASPHPSTLHPDPEARLRQEDAIQSHPGRAHAVEGTPAPGGEARTADPDHGLDS